MGATAQKNLTAGLAFVLGIAIIESMSNKKKPPSKPAKNAAKPKAAKPAKIDHDLRTPAGRTAYDDSILSHVSKASAKISMREILANIGGTPNQIRASLSRLIDKGLVAWEGRTRNTTYFVPGVGAST